jgi:hypothetical protein
MLDCYWHSAKVSEILVFSRLNGIGRNRLRRFTSCAQATNQHHSSGAHTQPTYLLTFLLKYRQVSPLVLFLCRSCRPAATRLSALGTELTPRHVVIGAWPTRTDATETLLGCSSFVRANRVMLPFRSPQFPTLLTFFPNLGQAMRRARIHEHERLRRLGRWLLEWRARLTRTLTQELYSVVAGSRAAKKRRSQPVATGWDSLIRARRHILARALRGSGATGKAPGTHDLQPRTFLNLYKIAHSRIRRWTKGITRLQT